MQKMITSHINSISMPCLDTFNGAQDYSITVHIGSITTKLCIKKKLHPSGKQKYTWQI